MKMMEIKIKLYQLKNLDMTRQYLSDIVNDHKTEGEWKI